MIELFEFVAGLAFGPLNSYQSNDSLDLDVPNDFETLAFDFDAIVAVGFAVNGLEESLP